MSYHVWAQDGELVTCADFAEVCETLSVTQCAPEWAQLDDDETRIAQAIVTLRSARLDAAKAVAS